MAQRRRSQSEEDKKVIHISVSCTTPEEKQNEILRLTQEIINCDNYIMQYNYDPTIVDVWVQKKLRFEYMLQDLQTDEFI